METQNRIRNPKIRARVYLSPTRIVNAEDIPVFINNRDRLSTVKTMVDWLLSAGTTRITILDNASTYWPLLEYYNKLPKGVSVKYFGENLGPWSFWDKGMHGVQDVPYVVTDSDLVPAEECPKDLIYRLNVLLNKYPDSGKVGPGIKIDDIEDYEGLREANGCSLIEQRDYWTHRCDEESFFANIDTTFAMYPAYSNGKIGTWFDDPHNIRMDKPYLVRHTPWYVKPPLSEEEIYYRKNCKKGWSHSYSVQEA